MGTTPMPACHEPGEDLGGEGPARAGHLGRARLRGVDVLVRGDGPAAPHVPVADGMAVHGQVGVQGLRRRDRGDPQAHAPGVRRVRRQELDPAPAVQGDDLTGIRLEPGVLPPAQLHRPQLGGQDGGEMHLEPPPRPVDAGHRRGQSARRVDDDEVALVEKAGQLREVRVHERAVALVGHEHAHRVPRHAACLGRRSRLELGGQHEGGQPGKGPGRCRGEDGHDRSLPTASSGAGRRVGQAVAPARRCLLDQAYEVGHDLVGPRSVRDVLAGEGVLVHLRPHVAGVDGPHAQRRLLGGEHGAHVVEGRLGEPVSSPPLVRLDRSVRGDVEHGRARRVRARAARDCCTRARGATTLTSTARRNSSSG